LADVLLDWHAFGRITYHWLVECCPQLDLVTKQTDGLQHRRQGVFDMVSLWHPAPGSDACRLKLLLPCGKEVLLSFCILGRTMLLLLLLLLLLDQGLA
jgi:hypothetical protein